MNIAEVAKGAARMAKSTVATAARRAAKAGSAVQRNHEQIADHADTAAKGARVAAGFAVVGAAVAAPTGVTAVGVWLGVASAPFVMTAAPVLVGAAGVALTVSAGASLYSKVQKRRDAVTAQTARGCESGTERIHDA